MFIFYFNAAKALDLPFKHGKKAKLVLDDIMPHKSKRCIATNDLSHPKSRSDLYDFYGFVPSAHLGFPTHDFLAARGLVLFRAAVQQPSPEGLIPKPHQVMERDPNRQKCRPYSTIMDAMCIWTWKRSPWTTAALIQTPQKNEADTFRTSKSTPLQRIIPNIYPLENLQNPPKIPGASSLLVDAITWTDPSLDLLGAPGFFDSILQSRWTLFGFLWPGSWSCEATWSTCDLWRPMDCLSYITSW